MSVSAFSATPGASLRAKVAAVHASFLVQQRLGLALNSTHITRSGISDDERGRMRRALEDDATLGPVLRRVRAIVRDHEHGTDVRR